MKTDVTWLMQPTDYSCVTTCLAMILGHDSPNEIVAKYHQAYSSGDKNIYQIMDELMISYRRPRTDCLKVRKTYLVDVPSLNIMGGAHQVIFQISKGGNIIVFDPARGRKGKNYYSSTHYHLRHGAYYPVSWTVCAEILNISVMMLGTAEEARGRILTLSWQKRLEEENLVSFKRFVESLDTKEDDNDIIR